MVDVEVVEGEMSGGEERRERGYMAAETQKRE